MKAVIITPTPPDINAFGVRILSSVLKENGIHTKLIFLPGGIEHLSFDGTYVYQYQNRVLEQIAEICNDVNFIGFSFMSQYFDRAAQITEFLKNQYSTPIIWGGTHPTYRPDQSIKLCDSVCIGEGEYAIVNYSKKIAEGKDYTTVKSCWHNVDGHIKKNQLYPVVQNLDELPFADYDLQNHYVYDWIGEEIIKIDDEIMKSQFLRMKFHGNKSLITYRTMASRGCPHKCAYCASSAMQKLRRRSVANVIGELKQILDKFNYIELISFFDDTFFAASVEYFEEFRDRYKKEISLPFHAQCSPTTINEQKMELLIDAGLFFTEMGIQTGSEKIKKIYRRRVSNQKIFETAALIYRYRSKLLIPDYHVILDNPWETTEDVKDTLNLLLSLPGKFTLQISSLVLFPGTELNVIATKEGLIKDELNEICRKPFTFPKGTYLNYLVFLSGFPMVPRFLLKGLAKDVFIKLFHSQKPHKFFNYLFWLTMRLRLAGKGIIALLTGDFGRIINYFKLAR